VTNWRNTTHLTGADLCFIGGVLVGAGVVAVAGLAGVLWALRVVVRA
jgi:hypothetical protein